jgi:hypothetical protein
VSAEPVDQAVPQREPADVRPGDPQLWSRADRRWDRIRLALVVGWLVLAAATAMTGERSASWNDVRAQVATGEIDAVRVSGEMPTGSTGFSTVQVRWQDGPFRYRTEVVQVRGRQERPSESRDGVPVLRTTPSAKLLALQPGLQVQREQRRQPAAEATVLGWHVPSALAWPLILLAVGGLAVLVAGPAPWRATRWGWFWLMSLPVGSFLFVLLSGPAPGLPRPRDPRRRLTGGWAFLLAIPLKAVLGSWGGG